MKFIVKVLLGTTVFGGLVGVYFADEARNAKKAQEKREYENALYFENKDCLKFSVQNSHGKFSFERENFASPWRMIFPKNVMADQDEVNNLLMSVKTISVQRILPSDTNLDTYGLSAPLLRFEVTLKGKDTRVLSLGRNINDNSEGNVYLPSAYANVTGRQNILVVDDSSFPTFNSKDFADLRTKKIGAFKLSEVNGFQIDLSSRDLTAGSTSLEVSRSGDEWSIRTPQATHGNQNAIFEYIQIFNELVAENVIEPPLDDFAKKNQINLNSPGATIIFKDKENILQKMSLYMAKSGVYITMSDGALAQVDIMKWADLVPKFTYFRDRSVLRGINVISCVDDKQNACTQTFVDDLAHLTASDMIDNASAQDLQTFGFKKPIRTLTCSIDPKNSKSAKSFDILVGNRVPLDEKNVYIKRSDLDIVYIVNSEWLSKLAQLESL